MQAHVIKTQLNLSFDDSIIFTLLFINLSFFPDEKFCSLVLEKEPKDDITELTDICDGTEYKRITNAGASFKSNLSTSAVTEKTLTFTMNTGQYKIFCNQYFVVV